MDRPLFEIERCDLEAILDWTRPVWDDLRGARIFITGGTGFYGKWLLATLLWANKRIGTGLRICVLTRDPAAFLDQFSSAQAAALIFSRGNICDFSFPDGAFSHIIHAATETNAAAHSLGESERLLQSIVGGTERVLAFAAARGATHLLYASSGAVYGEQPADLDAIPEAHASAPLTTNLANVHGSAKRYAELLCNLAQLRGLRTSIARGFAFVGPHLPFDGHFAIGNFMRDALLSTSISVSNRRPIRSYLYAADLAAWLVTMLVRGSGVYNVGSDAAISIGDLAVLAAATLAPGTPILDLAHDAPAGPRNRYIPNIDRARSELGLEVWTPLPEAMRRTAKWYEDTRNKIAAPRKAKR